MTDLQRQGHVGRTLVYLPTSRRPGPDLFKRAQGVDVIATQAADQVRCPRCGQLWFKVVQPGGSTEVKCRCNRTWVVQSDAQGLHIRES